MKKHVFLWVSVSLMLLTSMFSNAQTVYFSDGFENGFAEGWSQEYFNSVTGKWVTETPDISQPWKTESGAGLQYPKGAAVGNGRAYFRQEAAPGKNVQTTGYRTRLITPKMDLSGYQPILRFYHAQAKWTADFDTLRVFYRQGDNTQWELLSEYTSYIQKWKFEEIDLPLTGVNYQIAFEANENMGRGIVLDSVIIRTKPQITTPHDMAFYDMRDNGVNLTWEASKDADAFRVVVSEMDLDLNVNPTNLDSTQYIVLDTIIESDRPQDIRLENLAGGRMYYMQVQSIGEFENSVWSETYSFRMKPVVNITAEQGYFEDFNIPYKSNQVKDMQLETWVWGGDKQPIIPTWIGTENYYMYSPDASCAVVFTGKNTSSSGELTYSVPAGEVQYIVSPEISGKDIPNFKMSMCHVTFWGTTYKYQQGRAKSIIVGVATDANDPTTFVPVDTCEVWGYTQFTWFDVDLSSYTGDGRYIAFVSNFQDKENWFALDKVTIELKPEVKAVTASDIKVVPAITEAQISWPAVEGATSYKVKYLALEKKGSQVPLTEDKMTGAITVSANTNAINLTELTARTKYAYSVQVVKGNSTSTWSQPREFYTSVAMEIPKKYEFEESEGRYTREGAGEAANEYYPIDWCVFTNDADAPYLYTSYYRSGSRCLYLVKNQYNDAWTVSPMIEDIKQVEVVFYARLSSTSYPGSNVVVGVMEDPSDLKTFTPIATCTPAGANYERFYTNFTNYKGTGKYVALLWGESGVTKNGVCIDDLTFRGLASCFAPAMEIQATDSSAVLKWTRNDENDRYYIKVSAKALTDEEVPAATGDTLLWEYPDYHDDTLLLSGLKYSTQYYVYAKTICSSTDESEWIGTSFKTDCPEMMSLPYKNDFESENYSGSNSIPACWNKPTWSSTSSVYPYLSSSYNHDPSGEGKSGNCLYMYSYTTYGSTIALPKLDGDLENVKLRFWIYYSSAGYKVFAGVMGNTNDPNDFYAVDTFETVASTWVQCEAMFTAEDLKHGQYLAISSFTGASNYAYLDDVEVINVVNAAPFNYKKVDAGTNWFEVKWDGKTTDKWAVAITSKNCGEAKDFDPAAVAAADLIKLDTVATNGYKVNDGLESLTWYYIYAKSTAGEEWSMDSIQTECTVWNPRVKAVQGFEVDAAGNQIYSTPSTMGTTTTYVNYFKNAKVPECWTVGNAKFGADPSQRTSSGYIPYICTDGTAASANPTTYAEKAATTYQYSSEGINSLKIYSYYSSTASSNQAPAWAAMNKLDCSNEDLKSLVLTFDYQMATTAAYGLVVGIMDDPTDLSTFVVLDSIPGSAGTGTGSHKHNSYEIALDQYEGTGRYIAFRGRYGATTICYLDNVSVSLATCPNPKPAMSQITDNSAVIASGLRVDNGWKYIVTDTMYQAANLDAGQMPDAAHIVAQKVVEDEGDGAPKMQRVTGLSGNTTYYVYVVTLCDNNETSAWKMVEFTTLCDPVDAATWVGNFENDTTVSGYKPECWTVGSLTAGAAATYIPYVVSTTRAEIMADPAAAKTYNKTTGAVTGAKVLRLYAYGTATSVTSAGAYAISPAIKVAEGKTIQDYQIMFKGYGTSAQSGYTTTASYKHNLRVGMTTDPSDLSKMVILDTVAVPTNTQQCFVELSNYAGEGKYIVFLLEKEDVNYSQVYIYDIHMDLIPACKVPGGIKLDTIGDTFVKASWNGNALQYKVAVSKKLYTDDQKAAYLANDSVIAADGVIFKTANANNIIFDGLEPNSVYYLYVQGQCNASESSIWSYESPMFHTECITEQPVPLKENFEKYATGEVTPDCWKSADFGGTGYPKVANVTSGATSGKQFELWSTSTTHRTVVMLPKVKGNLSDYIFSMDARSYSVSTASVVYVGTMSDISDSATFVPMDTFYMDGGNEFTHIEMELAKYNVVHDHIAITSGLGKTLEKASDIYIDNIRLGYPISCFAPKNLKVENIGLTSAELSFEPADTISSKWEIEITKVGGATQIFTTTQPSYTFTTLEPASAYSIIVRTDCDGDYSDYTDAITFNTKWQIDTYTWSFSQNEQGTVSVPHKAGAAVATYTLHPALVSTGSQATLDYSSNTTYLPYQIMNTTSLAYAEDKRDFIAGGDTARALRLYRYFSTSYAYGDSAAVILPYVVNPQGKQVSMDLRFGYAYSSNHSTATLQNVVSSTYPKSFLCIGTVDSLQTNLSTYQEITRVYAHPMVATDTLREASNYGWMHYVLPLDMNLAGKQLVVMIQAPATAYICIDNLAIEAAAGNTTPVITSVGAGDTYATINWTGNAENYNIYVVDTANLNTNYIPYLQDAPVACVRKIENVSGNSYKVTGLTAGGNTYAFYVEDAAKAAMVGALSNRAFATTVCEAIVVNGSYSYDFEPGPNTKIVSNPSKSTADGFTFQWPTSTTAGDTVYKTPECWTVGMTYASYDPTSTTYKSYKPSLRSNSMTAAAASQYRYARSGYSAMMFPCSSTTYMEGYAVMPLMTGYDPDTMEINFWGRCTYEKVQGGTIYTTSYLKGTSYSTKMIVGTMTDPEDPSTFVALDTIEYDYTANDMSTSTVAASDPTGNSYWLNFTVPMKGATGSYIAFRQHDHGYFYMDDLSIRKRQTARRPWNLDVVELGSTSAKVTWNSEEMAQGGKYIIQVSTSATNWETPMSFETTQNTFEITGLEVAKEYFFRVKQEGSIYGNTDFAHYVAFTTECLPLNPNGYKTGFECDDEVDPWTVVPGATGTNVNTMKQNQCWTYWNMGTTQTVSSSYFPYNIANTSSNGYSHSGGYALKINQYTSTAGATTYRMCVVSPYIDAELGEAGKGFDTLQVSFYACPTYHGLSGTNKDKISSASGTSYAKYIEIGTCTDPADSTTYTVLQGWTYEVEGDNLKTGVQADANNDYAFRKVTVKLNGATGNYVFIRPNVNRGDGKTGFTYSTMYIDDLQFEKLLNCPEPENVEAVEVTTRNAKVQWTGEALMYDLQVSADPTFTDEEKFLVDTTDLAVTSFFVENLEPAKQYYFRVKAYCDAAKKDASDWTMTANFKTPYAPLYTEDFTMNLSDWRMAYGYANKVFAGKAAPRDTTSSSTYNSWYRVQNLALSGYAVRALLGYAASANPSYPISSTYQSETYYQKYWLISPSITIEKENAQLAFEAALTHYTSADPITVHDHWNEGWDNQFMVIISEDDGKTWKQENAVIWNNETTNDKSDAHYKYGIGDYVLTDIPATPTELTVDLTKYAGKTIRIAFYAENTDQNSLYGIHVDKIHVNYLVKTISSVEICQFEDIEDEAGFDINGDTVQAGPIHKERLLLSYENGVSDSLFVLDANYKAAPQYYYEITICEGTPFEYMGFNEHTAPGTYRMKLISNETGCDSIVNFTIRHAQTLETTIDTTICYGSYIDFNGQRYNEAGKYVAYLKASEKFGGCDSIVTLNLSVTTPILTTLNQSICAGSEYYWADADTVLTTRGAYSKIFPAANGCDSVVTLTLSIIDPVRGQDSYQLPEGGSYTIGDLVINAAGTYDIPSGTAASTGCDSITALTVTIIPAPVTPIEASICKGATYSFAGKELSEAGVYRDTTYAAQTHYMAITELHLSIIEPIIGTDTYALPEGGTYTIGDLVINAAGIYNIPSGTAVSTGCDSITTLTVTITPAPVTPIEEAICKGATYSFAGKVLTEAGVYRDTTYAEGTHYMAITELHLSIIEPITGTDTYALPEGGSYQYGDQLITAAGQYQKTDISTVTGCDSITTLTVTITPAPVEQVNAAICKGDSYTLGNKVLTEAGVYRDTTYAAQTHYMAITELHLSIIEPISANASYALPEGGSYQYGDQLITAAGIYQKTDISTVTGCDSITTLTVTITPAPVEQVNAAICKGDSYQLGNKVLTEAGVYRDTTYAEGTHYMAITELHLSIIEPISANASYALPEGGSYQYGDQLITAAGIYQKTDISTVTGCDSITTLTVTITPAPVEQVNAAICKGDSYQLGNKVLTEAGVYRDTTYAEGTHYMAITELHLSINPILTKNLGTKYINEGESYDFYGKSLTVTGSYYDTVPSKVTGCDSINYINLVVLTNTTGTESQTVCSSELPIVWKGMNIDKEGTYTFDTLTIFGTDSLVVLSLEVIEPVTSTIRAEFCEGGSYELNNKIYSLPGTYYDTLVSAVTGCDSIITLVLTRNAASVTPMSATICAGDVYQFGNKELTAAGIYRDTVYAEGTHCMEIMELTLSVTQPVTSTIRAEFCEGGSYELNNKIYSLPGTYYDTLVSAVTGCDSIITLVLTRNAASVTPMSATICAGDVYQFGNKELTAAGIYRDTVYAEGTNCMEIMELTLSVTQPVTSTIRAEFCEGGSYELNNKIYSLPGTYYDTLVSAVTGCDSIITLVLTRNAASVTPMSATICAGDVYQFGNKELTAAGIYRDTVYAEGTNCMEIMELTLSVTQPVTSTIRAEFCEGGSYELNNKIYSLPGTYYDTLVSAVTGCDSIITLVLTRNAASVTPMSATICAGDVYQFGNKELTAAGIYRDTVYAEGTNCMEIMELTLSVTQPVTSTIRAEFCEGGSYELNNKIYSLPGTYYDTLVSAVTGCDSIITLVLTRNAASVTPMSATICAGDVYQFGNKELTAAGIYRDTVYAEGTHCMEIIELTLTVNQPVSTTLIANICAGETYDFFGQQLTQTGSYSHTLTSIAGCDSTIYLTLNVSTLTIQNIAKSICEGDSYQFAGQDLTEEGTYFDTIRNAFGCDSMIIVLTLNINKATEYEYTYNLCAGGTYDFFGQQLTQAGDYTDTIANKLGCDSIVTVHLLINEPLTGTHYAEFCGESYTYQGVQYGEGEHKVTIKNEQGCDSIVTLILTKTTDVHDTLNVIMCKGEIYKDEHFIANTPGIYYAEETQPGGCTVYYVLNFSNYPSEMSFDTTILVTDLPYEYEGQYYGEGTEPGDYQADITVTSLQGCDLTIHLTLHVKDPQDIKNIYEENGQKVLKVLYRDHMYIIRQDGWYTVNGQKVESPIK